MTLLTKGSSGAEAIEPDRYREVMRHHPTGVAAVSSLDAETRTPHGLIVGTLASLPLEPALITFSVDRTSSSWPKISRTGKFTISLLAEGQKDVSEALSRKQDDKFTGSTGAFRPSAPRRLTERWDGSIAPSTANSAAETTYRSSPTSSG